MYIFERLYLIAAHRMLYMLINYFGCFMFQHIFIHNIKISKDRLVWILNQSKPDILKIGYGDLGGISRKSTMTLTLLFNTYMFKGRVETNSSKSQNLNKLLKLHFNLSLQKFNDFLSCQLPIVLTYT